MSIDCPVFVYVGQKKIYLNLGVYRNLHYQINNKAKIAFGMEVMHQIAKLPKMKKISIHYVWNPKTYAKGDVSNVCSVVDKFFCDVLTKTGKITDDNYTVIPSVSYEFGGVDKINPRVVAKITEIKE